ncbi:single-stranded nucleic acid binding R3H [Phascolomyces articulosus]|uniref:Single-stranded nucleic acid binding R3H n=1 Tax=Phascolomyces articulosus TaxID=60185 RepID=A0AAD5KB02_9FUNG|nr:single-stranded nucleic acid binding R3H [Phascolomyces articulosus]
MGGGGSGGGSSSSSSSSSFDPQQESESNEANNTLDTFILSLLKKPQERIFLLKLEKDLEDFINNHQVYRLDLPQMNSYQRLMVHKVAPYFKLSHFAEPVRKSVFLCKNAQTAM